MSENERINANMTYADTPIYCRLVDCGEEARILLYVVGAGWTPICDKCIDDLAYYKQGESRDIRRDDYEQLVQVAEMYVDAFTDDDRMNMLEAMRLTMVRDAIARWRNRPVEPI